MSTPQLPHAALLIDFDNVTMGIRSDLSKELKNLLSSDFIKGKVAVQRAYADWRRYPQYIVPLAESSVDLIFAPAYGSSKKNATDIRLAIDALELVFTRPEIGTYILLSGDSDFSSLVLKLKEYGKYVVGVGIRESASDLLVQNCDEYYSYSALTGLTRAGEETSTAAEDPWELVELAIKQMVDNNDVMRSDRLKQVILEMDPNFDEKALGFQKFNRFMQEAAGRGLVSLRKLENGQYEVGLPGVLSEVPSADEVMAAQQGNGRRRSRRGRGRDREREGGRERDREGRPESTPVSQEPEVAPEEPVPLQAVAPVPQELPPAEPVPAAPAAAIVEPLVESRPGRAGGTQPEDQLRSAYGLLRRAVGDVAGRTGEVARDSDIKRRMLELEDGWDEAALGFSKFSRFLRQAHDAEVINLRKLDNGGYEASLATGGESLFRAESAPEAGRGRGRRERGRTPRPPRADASKPATSAKDMVVPIAVEASAIAPVAADTAAVRTASPRAPRPVAPAAAQAPAAPIAAAPAPAQRAAPIAAAPAPAQRAAPAAATRAVTTSPKPGLGIGMRRGSRGRLPGAVPPPLLEGQTVPRLAPLAAPVVPSPATPPVAASAAEPGARKRRGRRGGGAVPAAAADAKVPAEEQRAKPAAPAPAVPAIPAASPQAAPETARRSGRTGPGQQTGSGAERAAPAPAQSTQVPTFESLGLPTAHDEVVTHLLSWDGVGPRTVQSLVDAFGAAGVFRALQDQPERVREVLGGKGARVLEAWHRDHARRVRAQARKPSGSGSRGRRGGRGGKRTPRAS